jgi:hypothetical protein
MYSSCEIKYSNQGKGPGYGTGPEERDIYITKEFKTGIDPRLQNPTLMNTRSASTNGFSSINPSGNSFSDNFIVDRPQSGSNSLVAQPSTSSNGSIPAVNPSSLLFNFITPKNNDLNNPTSNLILDSKSLDSRYNGRVNIIEPDNPDARFQMFEKIAVKNKTTEYREAMIGEWECNTLSNVFFSEGNIQILQNGLRAGVYKMSGSHFVIPPQNIDTLKIIMRSIYLQYAEHYATGITAQVERLNEQVWKYAVPSVYNETMGYMKYLQDQSSLVVPLDMPIHHDRQYKQLELKSWF